MFGYAIVRGLLVAVMVASAAVAHVVTIDLVPVGNPGNAGELSGASVGGFGPDRICGAVNYSYQIGKYEVTAGQYTEFLNAKAKSDPYGLYNTYMDTASFPIQNLEFYTSSPKTIFRQSSTQIFLAVPRIHTDLKVQPF